MKYSRKYLIMVLFYGLVCFPGIIFGATTGPDSPENNTSSDKNVKDFQREKETISTEETQNSNLQKTHSDSLNTIIEIYETGTVTKDLFQKKLEEVTKQMESIPADVAEDSPEGKLRTALKKRSEILNEIITTIGKREDLSRKMKELPEKRQEIETKLNNFATLPPVHPPNEPTQTGLAELQKKLETLRSSLNRLKEETTSYSQRLENIPAIVTKYIEQENEIDAIIKKLSMDISLTKEGIEKETLTMQRENAKLENIKIKGSLDFIEKEVNYEKEMMPLRNKSIEYLQQMITRTEEEYRLYQKALEDLFEEERKTMAELHEKKVQAAEEAKTQYEKFITKWEEKIAREQTLKSALEQRKVILSNLITQQEKRIQNERDNYEFIKKLVSKIGTSGSAGERIKRAFLRIKDLRSDPKKISGPPVTESLMKNRSRLFELDEIIFALGDHWSKEFEEIIKEIPAKKRNFFEAKANSLRDEFRSALLEEQSLLTEVIAQENKLQNMGVQMNEIIDNLEEFILPRLFWVRDAVPLSIDITGSIASEIVVVLNWIKNIFSVETFSKLILQIKSARSVFLGFIIFILLPVILFYSRMKVRSLLNKVKNIQKGTYLKFLALLSSLYFPVYLILTGILVKLLVLPESIDKVLFNIIAYISVFIFLWMLNRQLFSQSGLLVINFNMQSGTAKIIYRTLEFLLIAYIIVIIPSLVLNDQPFDLEMIPRIGYTIFSILALMKVFFLVRISSPLIQDVRNKVRDCIIYKNWVLFSGFAMLVLLCTIIMDILGYRFGARWISTAALLSFFTVIILDFAYHILIKSVKKSLKRLRYYIETAAPGTQSQISYQERLSQVCGFIKTLFILTGAFLFVIYWGINRGVINVLDKVKLYDLSLDPPEFITIADIFKCVIIFIITMWVLRNLRAIYEITVFRKIKIDAGVRYAILTISRYGIFFIGTLIALSTIHLDLSRIGWLMAAIGFGLGFGMQEIFSNFVSGLILLLERPVRVGDITKVGDILGTITRINIRATTVTSFDRLENIVPNKDFITKAVTNWTLADKVTRVIIKIGVAYGSDIDEVRKILLDLASEQPEIMKDPPPSAFFLEHGDSTLNFELRFFVDDPSYRLPLTDRMNTLINKEFARKGISIAFPQRDVHIFMEKSAK